MATRSRQQLEAEIRAIADLKRNLSPAERQRLGALANQLAGVVGKPITVHRSVSGLSLIHI